MKNKKNDFIAKVITFVGVFIITCICVFGIDYLYNNGYNKLLVGLFKIYFAVSGGILLGCFTRFFRK